MASLLAFLGLWVDAKTKKQDKKKQTTPETGTQPILSAAGDTAAATSRRTRRVACVACERGREGTPASWRIFGGARGPEHAGGLQEAIDFRHRRTRLGVLMMTSDSFKRSVIPQHNTQALAYAMCRFMICRR